MHYPSLLVPTLETVAELGTRHGSVDAVVAGEFSALAASRTHSALAFADDRTLVSAGRGFLAIWTLAP